MAKNNKGNNNFTKRTSNIVKQSNKPVVDKENHVIIFRGSKSISDLAKELSVSPTEVIKFLFLEGKMVNINSVLDAPMAELVCMNFGYDMKIEKVVSEENFEELEIVDEEKDLVSRPPIVTIMGHVDHGKTTLLDAIRKSRVVEGEVGGITQSIGAYQVEVQGKKITFLDTPGHEAFAAMRARGAQVTDIVILVVAADDGVMPQTREAIDHAKAAGVPIVVAVNKMDKPDINLDRLYAELSECEIISEEWGGENIFCKVSAKIGQGIDELLESLLIIAELEDYKANPNRYALGTIIESKLEKGRGVVATLLVENGTLRHGDCVVAGTMYGKIRQMRSDLGKVVKEATPSTPVEIIGLSDVPSAGDKFMAFEDEKKARDIAAKRLTEKTLNDRRGNTSVSLDDLYNQIKMGDVQTLNIIIKADSDGSAEAVKASLMKLNNDEVKINVIRAQAGAITESDVLLASASKAIIYGFNVRPDASVRQKAEEEKVELRLHRIIYALVEEIEAAMKGMLKPVYKEVVIGNAEVRQTYKASKVGTIAGCYVTNGSIKRDCGIRLLRNSVIVYEGKLGSLKRFQNDAKEVATGYECGITIENFNDIKEGDTIEGFVMEEVKR
ncbi:MAG: translation initiation factor IF-2 [Bacilli bacterium]|nr:translation initiation factor IF-2 [Bacilli bacterium]